MPRIENEAYIPSVPAHSENYWRGLLVLDSDTQKLGPLEDSIIVTSEMVAAEDIRSIATFTEPQTGYVEMSVDLEAEDEVYAMDKLSGLALLSLRKAGVDLEQLILLDGRLASGLYLTGQAGKTAPTIDDARFALGDLESVFVDVQDTMIHYDADETY